MKKKNMNKITLMLVVLLLFSLSLGYTMAEEPNNLVYVEVPADWNEPSLWAWAADGTNAFDAWPGEKMIADENNAGWYYLYVPNFVSSIIVNANEGTVQTSELKTNQMNAWVTIKTVEEVSLTNDKMTQGELPEEVKMITVNAYVPKDWEMPSLWAWSAPDGTNVFPNWPGQELEGNVDGWYSYKIPAWVNSVIINANAGTIQTGDVSIESKDVWIVVSDKDNVAVSYEKPSLGIAEEMIKIHAKTPEDWLMPSLWAWSAPDGTNVFPNWPGQELEEENGWYTYSIPAWVNSIIINGNLGAVQTTDVSIESKDLWIVVKDAATFEVFYEEPVLEENPAEAEPATEEEAVQEGDEKKDNSTPMYLAAGAAVIVLGGLGFFLKKKK